VQGRQGQVSGEGYLQGGVQVAIQTRVECVGIIHHLVKAQVYPRKILAEGYIRANLKKCTRT